MASSEYRLRARQALRGNWPMAVVVTLVAGMLGAFGSSNAASVVVRAINRPVHYNWRSWSNWHNGNTREYVGRVVRNIWPSGQSFASLLALIVGGAVLLGLSLYFMRLLCQVPQNGFSTLFERMNVFGKAILLRFLTSLFIGLWSLLFVVPGIIAAYSYAMAPYLMAHNPNLGAMEAINLSKAMMDGEKMNLFTLQLSFIGWILLSAVTCGIGALFVGPYMQAAEAAFYLDLLERKPHIAYGGVAANAAAASGPEGA